MEGTVHLCIGWNFVTIGMRLLSAMCRVRHKRSALQPTKKFVVGSSLSVRGMTVPVVHVQASTEACQTIECNLSIRFCVILCRRLGSRNDLSSVNLKKLDTRVNIISSAIGLWFPFSCFFQNVYRVLLSGCTFTCFLFFWFLIYFSFSSSCTMDFLSCSFSVLCFFVYVSFCFCFRGPRCLSPPLFFLFLVCHVCFLCPHCLSASSRVSIRPV